MKAGKKMKNLSNRFATAATLTLTLVISSNLSGCAEIAYDSLHNDAQDQCKKLVNTDERIACNKRYQQSYDSYQKERNKLFQPK